MIRKIHNPDVLTCLANLSNDEVFTPPSLANAMLDLLPQTLFESPDTRFLDPCCKSGVFLREIAKRLLVGLKNKIPDEQERINHIFTKQLFGIAITEMTGLLSRRSVYCSKTANGRYSVCSEFWDEQGNITYTRTLHTWKDGRCVYCGASQAEYDRGEDLETHAYTFIHTEDMKEMQFDVIIGNPPYQLSDGGGNGTSAMPIYHKFIETAKAMKPRFLTMIVPSRWFVGGKGLDEFRDSMLHDNHLREIHDYPEAIDCFPGVQIKGGVCYFLWDRDEEGLCRVTTHKGDTVGETVIRPLLEDGCDTFIRYNEAIDILRKVQKYKEASFEDLVSYRRPFNIDSDYMGNPERINDDDLIIYRAGGHGYISRALIKKNVEMVDQYKVFIAKAGSGSDSFPHMILGVPFFGDKGTVCTETYLTIGPFDSREVCENVISYIKTRFFRAMVLLKKSTQNAAKSVYSFVPMQIFSKSWTDEELYSKYGLSEQEIAFVDSMIRPME